MYPLYLSLCFVAGEQADLAILGEWLKAAESASKIEKHEIILRGLAAIDRRQVSSRHADSIARLYGGLLAQDVPDRLKHQVCRTLTKITGLDSSLDELIRLASDYKAAAIAREKVNYAGSSYQLRFHQFFGPPPLPPPDEKRLADDLIAELWNSKSKGRSHFSAAIVRFPEPVNKAKFTGFSGRWVVD